MSPRSPEFIERINIFFSKEQMERIKEEALKLGLTVSAFIRMIVIERVNQK